MTTGATSRQASLSQSHHRAWNAVAIVLPIVTLLVSAVLVNWILPEPDSVDFRTLNRVSLLMDQRGWEHCVNHNWGFARPLATTLVTRFTGDLLTAQRLVSAAFALWALILAPIAHDKKSRCKTGLVLARQPGSNWASQVYERYNEAMLNLEADYTRSDTLIILHRDRDSQ